MTHDGLIVRVTVAAALSLAGVSAGAAEPEGRAEATLGMDVRKLDFEGNKKLGLMYMPGGVKLSADKPAWVTQEPEYRATAKYAVVTIGNTDRNQYVMAFDEPEGQEARVFADLNGNGDLTDDLPTDGKWEITTEREGALQQYSGTLVFKAHWKNADGEETHGEYALNFYRSPDRDSINYYRASARTGKIDIGNKSYDVMLHEGDGDGLFNKLYDPSKPTPIEKLPKPVTLTLDGDRFDIRGTFGFAGYNYVALVSEDGSKLVMEPTNRQISLPRPTERPQMLGAGGQVPEFEAIWWSKNTSESETPKIETFKISDFKGKKIVVLDLWATWCGPCMAGIPHLSKIAEEVKGQGVEVIALNVWDEQKAFERFAKEKGEKYAFRLARDPAGKEPRDASIAARLFKVSGIPATYVIGKDGKIVEAISGYDKDDVRIEHALVRMGVKIEGIKPEDAKKTAPPVKMVPMTGMNK